MSHQFQEHYFSVSERLSNILDNVGYSREDRYRKVTVATENEVFINMVNALEGKMRLYVFGSRGEGSTGPDLQSDVDTLWQSNMTKIVTDLSQCQPEMTNYLMVMDNHTHPGYVKLQCIGISPDYILVPIYLERNNDLCTTDSLNRAVLSNKMHPMNSTISGPALHEHHDVKELSWDMVPALRCSQWPQEGYEWFQRRRLYGWPKPIQIEYAWEYGCFVTPVGHPFSSECHLEWRLSFSIAERDIARSFEDTTMKVYILLKMIRKTYIEPVVGDAFSSYHCKVCMFWMRERTPHELWSNENILQCLVLCIRQLFEWATAGFCPDYFIVTNNIYDRKIFGAERNTLVQILRNLLSSNSTFLLGIKCCNLGQHMAVTFSRFDHFCIGLISVTISIFDHCIGLISSEERVNHLLTINAACKYRYSILQDIPQNYSTLVDYLDRIMYASKNLPYIMQYPLKHAMMILWSQIGFHIATICKENAHCLSRDQIDYLVALTSGCLSFGINSDINSVRLKLCGLGIELGNHDLIEICLQYISDYNMRTIFAASINDGRIGCLASCRETLCSNRFNTEELLQTQTSFSVVYLPQEMSITPKPLRMEMFRSIDVPLELREHLDSSCFWGVIDSLMCLYFFQYLNFSRQGKRRHKEVAMENMIHVITTELKLVHKDTAFNLLGYSFMQENQLTSAYRCFKQSLKIRPNHNAAKFYLLLLFNRIHATEKGCISFGIKTDADSVRFNLYRFGMELGNHKLIETSLQHTSDYHMRNRYSTEELLQTQTSFSVVYLPLVTSITPKPMRTEMFRWHIHSGNR